MVAYWLAQAKINNPVEYKKYTDLVPEIISAYGGPYSVVFPVAEHPNLAGRLPQFLFFLQKIETR